ncbi:MAG TPA: TldD/PmbA family protein [Armatimonadota bacterium]|jgi:predicted Zn-dependent protease
MTRDEALTLLESALSHCSADSAVTTLSGSVERATRYANNSITQNVSGDRKTLTVTVSFGQRTGSASTNQLDQDSLRSTARRAEEAARAADPDLEYLPPLPPQEYPTVNAWSDETAAATPTDRARIARAVADGPAAAGDRAAGSVTTSVEFQAIANSAGLRAFHAATSARLLATIISEGASGWAGMSSFDLSRIPVEEIAERAWRKARDARNPVEIEPAATMVVLEPQAVADLIQWIGWEADAKAADEGRSVFSGQEGECLAAPSVTIRSVPGHPDVPGAPFADDGAPTGDVSWIEDGVLRSLPTTRFWAKTTGRQRVDFPGNLTMSGGDASTEDLIARAGTGLLVTRFWYIRSVDPMKLLLTGMTRDGLYRIDGGRLAGAAVNMRFNESPLRMLKNVIAIGRPEPTRDNILAPPLLVRDFRFTSVTRF